MNDGGGGYGNNNNGYNGNSNENIGGNGWRGNINCYECGKPGHIARDCWSKRGKGNQNDDDVHNFMKELVEEKKEAKKKKEEEEQKKLKEEERRRELDLARRTKEMRLQLQTDIEEKWKRQQEEARAKAEEIAREGSTKLPSPKLSPRQKTVTNDKTKKMSRKPRKSKKKGRSTRSSSNTDVEDSSTTSTSDSGEDTGEEARKIAQLLREERLKGRSKRKQIKGRQRTKTIASTWEKGECSTRPDTPPSQRPTDESEPRTPLTRGYKGIPVECFREGFMDYTMKVMAQYSAKKVNQVREICEKEGIKSAKKDQMVMELVKKQTERAYGGFFDTPVKKTGEKLKNEEREAEDRTPPEAIKTTVNTRGKTKMFVPPRSIIRSPPKDTDLGSD
ncbi:hypothetical protein CBR_g23728 [Chara braunii]|uniref:CCHC-type domain-containing protein n=1 Tax=Chara braunii TaxID=69332 RepID=A0A388L521_CHABU|nr:hypothetical protein CBR_g23728 [Chara braunii]|eukprot:GBG77397.1 hypothetical protein CBR_g23728 [Chara braunii]